MNASSLLVPSPFGRAFLRAPPWLQETLRHHQFGPHQSDGHVLVHTCLRPAVPEDELVLEDHPDFADVGSRVTWTTTFGYILNTALTRMGGGDPAAGGRHGSPSTDVGTFGQGQGTPWSHCLYWKAASLGDRGQRTMAEQLHSCSDYRP